MPQLFYIILFSVLVYICILVQYMQAVHIDYDKDDVIDVVTCYTFAELFLDLG